MAEAKMYTFTYKELAEALVKKQGINEGTWGIYLEFALSAANIHAPTEGDFLPAAILPVLRIGLQRFEKENNLSVDAAKINPPKITKKGTK